MTKRNCKRFRNNKYRCLDGLRWCGLRGNWCMSAQSDKYNRQKGQPKFLCIYILFTAAKIQLSPNIRKCKGHNRNILSEIFVYLHTFYG